MLSVVVNFHNNRREAMNTLYSLSRAYQRDAGTIEFEVIAIDHGSNAPLDVDAVRAFGPEFRYRFVATNAVSPVAAINADFRGSSARIFWRDLIRVNPRREFFCFGRFSRFHAHRDESSRIVGPLFLRAPRESALIRV